jgi:hypothetical protein
MLIAVVVVLLVVVVVAVVLFVPRGAGQADASPGPASPAPVEETPILPAIPAFPSPAHRLAPGIYMFGQLWRFDGRAWHAELGDDCEPVVSIFDAGALGTCAVTWDSVYRRPRGSAQWTREHQSPNGRPRLSSGWGHPTHGLFAVGGSGTVLTSQGDGRWSRLVVPSSLATVISAVWGDDERLYLGTGDGRIASRPWSESTRAKGGSTGARGACPSPGDQSLDDVSTASEPDAWEVQATPTNDFIFDGVCTAHGVYAIAQSGEVMLQVRGDARWTVERKLEGAAKGLLADANGSVWASSYGGIVRSDRPGEWVREELRGDVEMCALASNGTATWAGGMRSVLMQRDPHGAWIPSPPGRSGTIQCLWVGPDGELLVGTDFMLEVDAAQQGKDVEVLASVSTR